MLGRARALVNGGCYFMTSNMRHPGDVGLRRRIAARFERVAAADICGTGEQGSHRRRVAVYRAA